MVKYTYVESISKLSTNERVARIKEKAEQVFDVREIDRNRTATRLNKRPIYSDKKDKHYYSIDTLHGRIEYYDSRGKHLGEVDFDFDPKKLADKSGKHDIIVK